MADIEKPAPERQKKPRSFGPPLLVVLGLFLVLAWVGSGQLDAGVKLSQDQYLWHLYNGRILEQEFKGSTGGTNTIVGSALLPEQPKAVSFRVQFADLRESEQQLQAIAAERKGDPIAPQQLDEALRGEWYRPVALRVLTSQRREGTARADAGDAPAAPPRTVTSEKLWLQVAAKSHHAWEQHVETERGTYDPGRDDHFYLPERSGHVWVELALDEASDVGGLVARLSGAGAAVERLSFDVTPDGGSSWNDAASPLLQWLLYGGPWIALLIFLLFIMRQVRTQGGAGGVMSFGRSRAQLYTKENRTHLTFDDVAGAEEAKVEVRELVEFLKNPGRFTRIGGRIPRGVLLVGPPGCGKTLLAKAIAGEAEVPFFSISGSDFVEMFVGVGASRVRDLFKQARENSPCIIFLDEIDAVGRRRGSGLGGGHDEREQTLNAILVEMDGFGTDEGIIVVAATNRADVLDPALLRPGRFDRQVVIDLPDVEGRKAILDVHLKKVKHGPEIESGVLARATPGYSGADLAAIVNEAAIMTVLDRR